MSGSFRSFFDYPGQAFGGERAFLEGCGDEDWALIRDHGELRRFSAGGVVMAPGGTDRALSIVVEGTVEVIAHRPRRRSTLRAGSLLGELGFLDGEPGTVLVRAVEETAVLRLSLAEFEVLAAKDPVLARFVLFDLGRVLATRLRAAQDLVDASGT